MTPLEKRMLINVLADAEDRLCEYRPDTFPDAETKERYTRTRDHIEIVMNAIMEVGV